MCFWFIFYFLFILVRIQLFIKVPCELTCLTCTNVDESFFGYEKRVYWRGEEPSEREEKYENNSCIPQTCHITM